MRRRRPQFQFAFGIVLVFAIGCGDSPKPTPSAKSTAIAPLDAAGLPHSYRVTERVLSGGSPEGEEGFASLQKIGVKTIVSVDGAAPETALAEKHGLRYVHLPVGYDGIPQDKVNALIRVGRDYPGPIYVHCHHGKHRGPAAVAAMLLGTDAEWNAERAEAWQKLAGTDPRYVGLLRLPRTLHCPTATEVNAVPAELPKTAVIPDLVRFMVEIDERWDRLTEFKDAGFAKPKNAPEFDVAHEAALLSEQFRETARLCGGARNSPEFGTMFTEAEHAARDLEYAVRATPPNREVMSKAFARTSAVCNQCHERFRDIP